MPIFKLAASRSYEPNDNKINRFKGTVGATSGSTTVTVTNVDPVLVSNISTLKSTRIVSVNGSTLPVGGTASVASGTTLTLSYPYTVSVTAGPSGDWMEWFLGDAPNEKQFPISTVINDGAATLAYMDIDGSTSSVTFPASSSGQFNITISRTLSGLSGSLWGYSKGNSN